MADRHTVKFFQADVFTAEPFGGNPVAVVPDADGLSDDQLQQIAREMNLSETVFVFPPTDPAAVVRLRIFTPSQEIPFAGHPVLGTFFILAELGLITVKEPVTRVMQECNIGLFAVELYALKGKVERIVMTQPKPEFLGRWRRQTISIRWRWRWDSRNLSLPTRSGRSRWYPPVCPS